MRLPKLCRLGAAIFLVASTTAANAAGPDTFPTGRSYYGTLGGDPTASRVVDLGAVKHVNVRYGETITFRNEGKQFTWTFDGLDRLAVDLSKIAPAGFPIKALTIYIPVDPLNRN